jgi:spore coat protein CotH
MTYRIVLICALSLLIAPQLAHSQTQSDFFDTNKLQEIRLDVYPRDWTTLKEHYLENTRYAADFHWSFNGKEVPVPEIAIRSRGQGSRSGIKPSLKVEFDYYESKQNFLGLKTIVLRANTQDASMMHERVAMELFKKLGMPVSRTPSCMQRRNVGLYNR